MPSASQWVFGPFRLDTTNMCLWHGCDTVALKPKTFTVLQYLVTHAGQLVTKSALLDAVWPETAVSDGVLKVCIAELRKALGDRVKTPQFIATVHRLGYRFVAPVTSMAAPSATPKTPAVTAPPDFFQSDASLPPGPGRPPVSLLERDAVLARLHIAWSQARQGQRQCVFVTGEAGIGKTALTEAFVAQAMADPVVWLAQGQCVEYFGTGEAYLPILEALGQLCRLPQGAQLVELLRQQAPTWLVQMPWLLTPEDREHLPYELHGATRDRMLREFAAVMDTLTAETPLLLVLEDLHWSDYATLDLLAVLARHRTPARLLVLGTYRPIEAMVQEHPLRTVVYGLQRQGYGLKLPLEGLSDSAVATYLDDRFPGHQYPEELAGWLYQHTNGNPLFVVTLVTTLQDRDILAKREGCWRLMVEPTKLALEVPEGIRPLLEQQLAQLAPDVQQVLEVASIAGVEFATAAVAAGLETDVDAVESCCEALVRRQLLHSLGMTTWPDGTLVMRYAFIHALYQHVAYQRLGDGQRLRLHQRLGLRLEMAYGAQTSAIATELAEHFTRGQDRERAVRYLHLAGGQAQQRSAHQEAIAHLSKGLEMLVMLPDTPGRARQELALQLSLGLALIATKGQAAPEVGLTYRRAYELCQQIGDIPQRFRVLYGLWHFHVVRAEHQAARQLGEQCLSLVQHVQDPVLLMEVQWVVGVSSFFLGEFARAHQYWEEGIALYTPRQHSHHIGLFGVDLGVFCLCFAAHTLWHLGYSDQASTRISEALTLAREIGHPFSLALALDYAAIVYQFHGEAHMAQTLAGQAITLCREQGFAYYLAWGTIIQGWALATQGQGDSGMAQMRHGLFAIQATGAGLRQPYYLAVLAEVYGQLGRAEDGLTMLAEALEAVRNTGEYWWKAELHRLRGELTGQQDTEQKWAEAEACFQQALDIARRQQAKSLELRAATSLARLWQSQGKRQDAYDLLAPVYNWFTEGFDTADLIDAKAFLLELGPPLANGRQ